MNKQRLMQSLSRMTVENGCTEAEAKTAREKFTKLRDAENARRKAASDEMSKYTRYIAEQEKARKIVEAKIAAAHELAKWARMLKEWEDELAYDKDVDYREFKRKGWWAT